MSDERCAENVFVNQEIIWLVLLVKQHPRAKSYEQNPGAGRRVKVEIPGRQGNREAVKLAAQKHTVEAFAKLERMGAVTELAEDKLHTVVAESYVKIVAENKSVLLVAPTWNEIEAVTQKVRAALKTSGRLTGKETEFEVFDSLSWTEAQKRDSTIAGLVVFADDGSSYVLPYAQFMYAERNSNPALESDADAPPEKMASRPVGSLTSTVAPCHRTAIRASNNFHKCRQFVQINFHGHPLQSVKALLGYLFCNCCSNAAASVSCGLISNARCAACRASVIWPSFAWMVARA